MRDKECLKINQGEEESLTDLIMLLALSQGLSPSEPAISHSTGGL